MKMKRIMMCLMVMAVALAFMPAGSFAASKTIKSTFYNQVIKDGNTAYCAGAGGIYKVRLKNGKVKSSKLVHEDPATGPYSYVSSMKKKGNYIYFNSATEGTVDYLMRIKATGGKAKTLLTSNTDAWVDAVAIKGKKIYYKYNGKNRVMSLNGKDKKSTSVKAVQKARKSNAKGYRVIIKEKGSYAIDYLKTPKGTYKIGKVKTDW